MKRCLACEHSFESEDWSCPRCGQMPARRGGLLRFAEDPASDGDGGFKPEYFAQLAGYEEGHFWFDARNRLIQWALRKFFPAAKSFFEVGCGTGFVLRGLGQVAPGLRLSGSEIFGEGLSFARTRLPDALLYQMDARRIPFEREFDVIGAFDVLEHIVEDEIALKQMFQAVCPGGGLLLTVPQHRFLWSAADDHSMHQRRYSRKELRAKVSAAGFQIERVTSFVSLLLPLMMGARRRRRSAGEFQPWKEFQISRRLNATLAGVLRAELALIARGVSFPAGGSLLLIGRRPADGQ